jgi:thiamine pyrophosphokinase
MKICYVIGAGNLPRLYINKENALIVAADGGLKYLDKYKPDIVVGDFDSLGFIPHVDNKVVLPVRKDVTDMKYGVDVGVEKGCDTFVLYGGTGGRPDHTFANIALLCDLSKRGKRGYLIDDRFVITAITNSHITLPVKREGTVSVFSFSDKAQDVTIKGLEYTLNGHTLHSHIPLGVSNSFIGQSASVSVGQGTLVIMWEDNNIKDFIDNLF